VQVQMQTEGKDTLLTFEDNEVVREDARLGVRSCRACRQIDVAS